MYVLAFLWLSLFCGAFAIPAIETNPLNDVSQEEKNQTGANADALLNEIKELERQKNDLYKEINKAIDESITALTKSNDTDAVTGVKYIQDLKKQMKEYNDTEDTADVYFSLGGTNDKTAFIDEMGNGTSTNLRRKMKPLRNTTSSKIQVTAAQPNVLNVEDKYLVDAQKDLDKLLNKGLTGEKLKERLERREKIRTQLEEWIKTKNREREKIKEYRAQQKKNSGRAELCPRSGYSSNKSKRKKGEHGCCRKCCKRSYLGCLKK